MPFDPCEHCGCAVRAKRVTVDLRHGERLFVFRNVPVGVCSKCGERYYPGHVLEQLDDLARHGLAGAKAIRVPMVDYLEGATRAHPANACECRY